MTAPTSDLPAPTAASRDVVERFFTAIAGGDVDAALMLLADDVTWFVPGDRSLVPWVGQWRGKDEMRVFFGIIATVAEPRAFALRKLLADEGDVVVLGRFAYYYPGSGRLYDDEFAMHFTVTDGRISSYRIHEDSFALANAYTGA